jgi:hypothetical protein
MSILQLINHPKTFLKDNAVWGRQRICLAGKGSREHQDLASDVAPDEEQELQEARRDSHVLLGNRHR